MEQKVKEKKLIFESFIKVEEGTIQYIDKDGKSKEYSRERINRDNASCVLIHNTESKKLILTKQFRFAISSQVKEPIIEIMAGKFSEHEQPLDAAIREAEEECGYKIQKQNIKQIADFFASPGYTTEKFFLYYATVTNADKVSEGGGLEDENEFIEVIEVPETKFIEMAKNAEFKDSKTLVAALWFLLQRKKND